MINGIINAARWFFDMGYKGTVNSKPALPLVNRKAHKNMVPLPTDDPKIRAAVALFQCEHEGDGRDDLLFTCRFMPHVLGGVSVIISTDSVGSPIFVDSGNKITSMTTSAVIDRDKIPQLCANLMGWHSDFPDVSIQDS